MKKFMLALVAIGISGCSTTPVSPDLARNVGVSTEFMMKQGNVPVTIIRDKGFVAGGCAITAYINGKKVAELETSEKATAYVLPGEIVVGAAFEGSGLCHGPQRKEREFIVKSEQPKRLRIFIDQSGNVDILPSTLN